MGFEPVSKSPERRPTISTPEVLHAPERAPDSTSKYAREVNAADEASSGATSIVAPVVAVPITIAQKDERLLEIESTLAEGLEELFMNLPPEAKQAFKAKGEEVAQTIKTWMDDAKLVARKVLKLIREWFGMVPNVNKYFLEQESKIKRDHIMELAKRGHDDVL